MADGFLGFSRPPFHRVRTIHSNHATTTDTMNKTEILAALAAAGVTADETMTIAQLKELAAANNVSLVKEKPVVPEGEVLEPEPAVGPDKDAELVAEKVRAGLTDKQAREVIARQRAEDAANAAKK